MTWTMVGILAFALLLTPLAAAEGEPQDADAEPETASNEASEPSAVAPPEADECSVTDNGDKDWDFLPVAPDTGGANGFVGVFVGTTPSEGGYSGGSFGVNTQCVEPGPIIGELLCLTDFTCELQPEP